MKFGIREVCDCEFRSLNRTKPLDFTIDTAKMSTLESASTTVYAVGGKGNARLMAWEGEKTLTFTVEDALLTTESFAALCGRGFTNGEVNSRKIKITSKDYAGYYSIEAKTLVRDWDDGEDHVAIITIPKAKLQSNLNISMAPTGDPSTFTFTFDAFPDDNGTMCELEIEMEQAEEEELSNNITVTFQGVSIESSGNPESSIETEIVYTTDNIAMLSVAYEDNADYAEGGDMVAYINEKRTYLTMLGRMHDGAESISLKSGNDGTKFWVNEDYSGIAYTNKILYPGSYTFYI